MFILTANAFAFQNLAISTLFLRNFALCTEFLFFAFHTRLVRLRKQLKEGQNVHFFFTSQILIPHSGDFSTDRIFHEGREKKYIYLCSVDTCALTNCEYQTEFVTRNLLSTGADRAVISSKQRVRANTRKMRLRFIACEIASFSRPPPLRATYSQRISGVIFRLASTSECSAPAHSSLSGIEQPSQPPRRTPIRFSLSDVHWFPSSWKTELTHCPQRTSRSSNSSPSYCRSLAFRSEISMGVPLNAPIGEVFKLLDQLLALEAKDMSAYLRNALSLPCFNAAITWTFAFFFLRANVEWLISLSPSCYR